MTSPSKQTMLVISPHPDDMEIGMGGTVAQAAANGARIISLVLTDGRRSPRSFQCSDDEMARIRKEEAEQAGAVLGVEAIDFFGLSDLRATENQEQARLRLAELLKRLQPSEIYIPHPETDRHPSHRAGAKICLDLFAEGNLPKPVIWAYEVWGLFPKWDRLEDISEFASKKAAAIECHRSQVTDISYTEGVLGLNRWRAVFTDPHIIPSHRYVEAFIKI